MNSFKIILLKYSFFAEKAHNYTKCILVELSHYLYVKHTVENFCFLIEKFIWISVKFSALFWFIYFFIWFGYNDYSKEPLKIYFKVQSKDKRKKPFMDSRKDNFPFPYFRSKFMLFSPARKSLCPMNA